MNRRRMAFLISATMAMLILLLLGRAQSPSTQAQSPDPAFPTPIFRETSPRAVPNAPNETTPPTVNWIAPVGNEQVYIAVSGSVGLEVSATDSGSGVKEVYFERWDAVNNIWVYLGFDDSPPYQGSIDISTLNAGWNQINANAYDWDGNWAGIHIWIDKQATFSCNNVTEIPSTECNALAALYNSTNGPNWTNRSDWLTTTTPCSWYGVSCLNGHVYLLALRDNQLSGPLPTQMGDFPEMLAIYMSGNQLNGNIPIQLGNLTKLLDLDLGNNQLNGAIPTQLGNLPNLTHLYLNVNQLNGSIPTQLSNRTSLITLNLCCNQLSGNLPTQLGNLTGLRELTLSGNQLSGNIPSQLGNLTNLITLGLCCNQLSGNMPAQLGNLTKLTFLSLDSNQLSGTLPAQLGNLINLTALHIEYNQLSGALPGTLTNLNNLVTFWFHGTTLCEPDDSAFQNWLATISDLNRTGVICAAPPSAEFDAWPQSGVAPLTSSMHIVSTDNISNCTWEYGDGQTGNSCAAYHDHIYTNAGSYTVKLTVSGPGGSDARTRDNYMTVTAPVQPPAANFTANPQMGSKPLTVNFTDQSSGNITSWSWNFGDGNTSAEQNPLHIYNSVGDFPVSLTVTGPGGANTKTAANYIHVSESAPVTPAVNPIANADQDGSYTVAWGAVANASSYELQERFNSGSWTTIYTGSSSSYDVAGKSAGEWCYQVRARNTGGSSDWSSPRCVTIVSAGAQPTLSLPNQAPAAPGSTVTLRVTYDANTNNISSLLFSVNYDQTQLTADSNGDGTPDAIHFSSDLPASVIKAVAFDANDTNGELDFTIADFAASPQALPSGVIAEITLQVLPATTPPGEAPVRFAVASFGSLTGDIAGVTNDGSVLIVEGSKEIFLPLIGR